MIFLVINIWLILMLIIIHCCPSISQPFYTNLKMSYLTGWILTINVSCDDKKVSSWIQIEFVIENFYKCFHIFHFLFHNIFIWFHWQWQPLDLVESVTWCVCVIQENFVIICCYCHNCFSFRFLITLLWTLILMRNTKTHLLP